jgi:conjugative relaxase-like TrwC/TraI family protein
LGYWGFEPGQVLSEEATLRLLACQDPLTGERLGSKLPEYRSRDNRMREAVRAHGGDVTEEVAQAIATELSHSGQVGRAFYDVTFAAPKSVSVYFAALAEAGEHELAEAVLAAHNEAAEYASAHLEEHTWVRLGRHARSGESTTGRYERPAGIVRIAFQHTTSRATDPHLHTHMAVVNRAPCADGKFRALHGRGWEQFKGSVASRYEQKLAALIEERTPARFEVRTDGLAREIAGIDPAVLADSSRRTRDVTEANEVALAAFVEQHNRPPTPQEQRRIHRMAGLESRDAKSHDGPRVQVAAWAARMGKTPGSLVAEIHEKGDELDIVGRPSEDLVNEQSAVRTALAKIQAESATWNVGVLTSLIAMNLPARLHERAGELAAEATADGNAFGVVDLTRRELTGVPGEFIDSSRAAPVWRDPGLGYFSLADHLRAEVQLAASARKHTVKPWTDADIQALRAEWKANGSTITADQAAAVEAVLRSPRAGDALLAAAGTGKSYVAGRIAEAWTARGGAVMGTATSQIAAQVLAEEGLPAVNATVFLQRYAPDNPAARTGEQLPAGSLLVFDEANMTSTDQLRRVMDVAARDNCKILFFGDPRQLDAVGAGGGLELMARENGTVAVLEEPLRFVEEWEKTASVRLREGDESVISEYTQRGRMHSGTHDDMVTAAVDRYVADVVRGHSSALITRTNGEAGEVSALVQQRLAQLGMLGGGEVVGEGLDGNLVTAGDRIQWRENVYSVDAEDAGHLTNREFLKVIGLDDRGRVHLQRESNDAAVYVPASWLGARAALGYAGTEHAFEGCTVDTGHTLVPGYVAMTRGKLRNEAWLTTAEQGDKHGETLDVTPVDLFREAMSATGRAQSAIETWRAELEAGRATANLSAIFEQVTSVAMRDATMDSVGGALGWDVADRISMEDGLKRLTTAITRAELSGHDRDAVLREAIDSRPLDRVDDLAAVLAHRVGRALDSRTPERAAGTWAARAEGLAGHGEAGRFAAEVGRHMDRRVAELGARAAAEPPVWAREQLGAVPDEPEQRDEWQRRAGSIAAYREQCGVSDVLPSVGARPHVADVALGLAWRDAARAAGRPVDRLSYQALPDSVLEANRAQWVRLSAAAPAYVEPELGRAYDAQRQYEADAALYRQEAQQVRESERAELELRAQQCDQNAAIAAERAQLLQVAHETRQRWIAAHERDQDAALESERELKSRGCVPDDPQQEPEQTCLFEITTEHEPIAAKVDQEQEPEAEVDRTAERETEEAAGLFDIERDLAATARQQPLAMDDEDQAADHSAREAVRARKIVGKAEDLSATLAEVEVRGRYAREQLARHETRQAEAEAFERERAERDAREVESVQAVEWSAEVEPELSYPDEPELDHLGM